LLKLAPDEASSRALIKGFEEAYQGRPLANVPAELVEALSRFGGDSVALGLRQGKAEAVAKALSLIADEKTDNSERLQLVQIFGQVQEPKCVPVLLGVLTGARDDALRLQALAALQAYPDPRIGETVLGLYSKLTDEGRAAALAALASRKTWTLKLLEAVDQGKVEKAAVPLDVVRQLTVHRDARITELIARHWGKIDGATTAEMQAEIARLDGVLRGGTGDPYAGKKLFLNGCAKCHKLFTDGGQVGPDLTAFQRNDIPNMLIHIVNPSAEIREGFETLLVATVDGRVLTGTLVEKDNQVLVLRGADGQAVSIRQDQIEEMASQKKSLMPEGLLKDLSDQQVRDLFAYLRSTQPLP
jgi:putative heme-binding domain-containing protein